MFQPAWGWAEGRQTDTSWWLPLPSLSWRPGDPGQSGDWAGDGDSLWAGEREEKKSFLVTYFPKLLSAPVSLAWTPLLRTPHPSSKQQPGMMPLQCDKALSGSPSGQLAGFGLTEWGSRAFEEVTCRGDWLPQIGCLITLEYVNELIDQAGSLPWGRKT